MNKNILRASIIGLFFFGPVVASAATPIIYFPFDEGKGTSSAASVGTGQALIQGGAGWVSGKSGTAVGFDAKSGEVVALGENIIPQAIEGTLSLWVKADTLSDSAYFFSARNPNDDKMFWTLALDREGRLVIRYRTGLGSSAQKNETSAILDKSTWYHVVVTANSQKYSYYVNGEEIVTGGPNIGKWIPDMLPGNLRYSVGSLDASDHTGVLSGIVDDVRILPGVLTLAEVKALYNETNEKGPAIPAGALPVIQLTLSQTTIPFGGSVSVSWSVTNADSCTASWTGSAVSLSGTETFTNLAVDKGYSLTCVKTGGTQATVGESVHVLAQGEVATTTPVTTPTVPVTEIVLGKGPTISRTLGLGSRGSDVTLLQKYLFQKGFITVEATGYFGKLTEAGVKAFQKAHGFEQVGFTGPKTRAKLLMTP